MQSFIMMTRLIREEVHPALAIEEAEKRTVAQIKEHLPTVKWVANYATMGPWDYIDVFKAPDTATAMKLAALVRYYGGAHTEVYPAKEWNDYEKSLRELAEVVERQ